MDDEEVIATINRLAEEEHELERAASEDPTEGVDRERLERVSVALDQAYDLLRQRRARRRAGLDPEDTAPRSPDVVEHYQQ